MLVAPAAFAQPGGFIPGTRNPVNFTVGDLSGPAGEALLEQRARAKCEAPATIQTLSRPATLPVGSFVAQSPSADTPYTCGMSIVRWVASAPPPPPQPTQFLVGDLSTSAAIGALRQRAQQACDGVKFSLGNAWIASSRPRAAYMGQNPVPNAVYRCGESVVIYRSLGPKPTPTPPRPFEVGDLASQQALATLQANVQATCAQDLLPQYETAASTRPAGTYLRQDPSAETIYACGETVTVWKSAGPPPPWPILAGAGLALAVGGWLGWRWLHPKVGVRVDAPRWSAATKGPVRVVQPDVALTVENLAPRAQVRGRLVILE